MNPEQLVYKLYRMSEFDDMAVGAMLLVTSWTNFMYFIINNICLITELLAECIDQLLDFLYPYRFLPN